MGGDGIKFLINLDSKISGPELDKLLDRVVQASLKANKAIEREGREFSALKSNIFSATVAGQLWAKGIEKGAEMAIDGVRKVGDLIKETINIGASGRRESMSLINLLGGKASADEALAYMDKWGQLSEFNDDKTKEWGRELLSAGYRGQQWKDAMAAAADAAALSPNKMAGAEEAISSLSRIQLTGKIDARSLRGLRLNIKDVVDDLGDALGMSPEAVKKGLEEGAIPAAKAYDAVLRALEKKTGRALGEAGLAAGKTLDAKLTHLREFPQRIISAVANSPGIDKIEKAFDRVLDAFDPNGTKGEKMVEGLGRLMDTVGQFLEETDWAEVAISIGGVATNLGRWIDPLSKIAKLTLKFAEAVAKIPRLGEDLGDALFELTHSDPRDQVMPASHATLTKTLEKEPAWGTASQKDNPLKAVIADQAAADLRIAEAPTPQTIGDLIDAENTTIIDQMNYKSKKAQERGEGQGWVGKTLGYLSSASKWHMGGDDSVQAENLAAFKAAAGGGEFGRGGGGETNTTHVAAKAEVTVNMNGSTGNPQDVAQAAKVGTESGLTAALEKQALHAGTKSARRKK